MKQLNFLLSLIFLIAIRSIAQPVTAPATPKARPASNVISIYSAAYTNHAGTDFNPNWGQSGFGSASEITVGTEKIRKYANLNYQGIDFGGGLNFSSMDSLHFDIWTPDCSKLDIYLIPSPANEKFVTVNLALSGWNSVSIPLSAYTSQGQSLNNIIQFKLVSNTPASGTTIYLDNIYFWTEVSLPTLSNFTVPDGKLATDAPFTLTPPTSNSSGAFTYTSSNTNVATISGNTVTLVGAGISTITASQEASGSYGAASINATLTVGYNPPTTAANPPAAPAADVISLLSSVYTDKPVNTWGASWESAAFVDTVIAGNPTKKYSGLNYSGTEFTGANSIDATAMNYFHVSVWSPNATPVKVKLVDFGADNAYGGGDDKTSIEYVLDPSPTPNTWHTYEIPMTSFTGLDTRAHLSQMLFVGSSTIVYLENIYFSKLSALPVSLAEFKATKNGATSLLSWKTASENNNKGFSVERSSNGTSWNQLQFVEGKGTTSAASQYAVTDHNPLNGVNYYRLKQIDFDGKENISGVLSVTFAGLNSLGFSFYPNPAKNNINVSLLSIQSNSASLTLVNVEGKAVKQINLNKQNSNSNVLLNLDNIAKGMYMLTLKDGDNIRTSKVVVN